MNSPDPTPKGHPMLPSRLLISLLMALLPTLAAADSTAASTSTDDLSARMRPLAPAELRAVQDIGRTVLGAKRSQVPDAEQEALHQELKALSAELDQAVRSALTAPPILHLAGAQDTAQAPKQVVPTTVSTLTLDTPPQRQLVAGPKGQLTQKEIAPAAKADFKTEFSQSALAAPVAAQATETPVAEQRFAKVRARLASLPARLQQFAAAAQQQGGEDRRAQTGSLSAKVEALEGEVQAALDAPEGERQQKLAALRERLQPKSLADLRAQRNPDSQGSHGQPESTPTLTTITRHR